jgi:hypothetical protein
MRCDKRAAALISFASSIQSSENQILVYKKKYLMGKVVISVSAIWISAGTQVEIVSGGPQILFGKALERNFWQ